LVVALERLGDDAARELRAALLLHDAEQLRARAARDTLARRALHRAPTGVGLDATAPAARTARAVELHDHVPDLARSSAAEPAHAVDQDAAADARAPPHAEERAQI